MLSRGTLSVSDFFKGLQRWFEEQPDDPAQWTFGGLTRQDDGRFQDADLVRLLQQGTEDVAGEIPRPERARRQVV